MLALTNTTCGESVIQESFSENLRSIKISNELLEVEVLPELGGKIKSIFNKESGKEYLLQSQLQNGVYKKADYGSVFEKFDTSGFDECFPNIEESTITAGDEKTVLCPDHGELWSREWDYSILEDKLVLKIDGVKLNYSFIKEVSLIKDTVVINYSVTNNDHNDLSYLWSAHPLLNVNEGDEIILPDEIKNMMVNWSSDNFAGGFGEYRLWPFIDGNNDFSKIKSKNFGKAVKLFSEKLSDGKAGVYFRDSDESLIFSFDVEKNPYLGIWMTYGGWPENSENKHLTVGIEPTSSRPDSLQRAIERNEAKILSPGSTADWKICLKIQKGKIKI